MFLQLCFILPSYYDSLAVSVHFVYQNDVRGSRLDGMLVVGRFSHGGES